MKNIIFTFSVLLAFSACKHAEPAQKLALDCYVRYLTQENQSTAEVNVRRGTTGESAQPYEIPGGLFFNGEEMKKSAAGQFAFYKIELTGGGQPQPVFSWKDEKNGAQSVKLDLPLMSDFNFDKLNLSRSEPATLSWTGAPLEKNERVLLLWNCPDHGDLTMEVHGATPAASVQVPAAELSKLQPGVWSLYLMRSKMTRLSTAETEVRGNTEYYTATKTFSVR